MTAPTHVDVKALYPNLINLLLDPVFVVDEEGRIVFISEACERLLGYTSSEMVGTLILNYIHPGDLERTLAAARRVMGGQPHVILIARAWASCTQPWRSLQAGWECLSYQRTPFSVYWLLRASIGKPVIARRTKNCCSLWPLRWRLPWNANGQKNTCVFWHITTRSPA